MKNLSRAVFAVMCFLVLAPFALADIAIPTETTVYFEMNGEAYDHMVDYEVSCYGYDWEPGPWPEEPPEGYDPENPDKVYSYSASCPEYGCVIDEAYYLNYREIEYCDLEGEADGETFVLEKYATSPIPANCEDEGMDRICEVTFDIPVEEVEEDPIPELYDVETEPFSDVALTDLYFPAIDYVRTEGIVNGYDDGTYKSGNEINRAEFTKIIVGATYEESVIEDCTPTKTFSDLSESDWYEKYVCVAANNGIIDGYDDGTFKGGDEINFVEAAKIIVTGFDLSYEEGGEWYTGYVKALQNDRYFPSTINSLNKKITRGEMAEMIWRIREDITDGDSVDLLVEEPEPIVPDSSDYPGWVTFDGDGFAFYHPDWHIGTKWGYDTLSPEYDFIFGDKEGVDEYVHAYTKPGDDLETSVWFDHPFVESENLTINGLTTLMRHYRAPRGTVVNGRTTGEHENIYVYTYKIDGKVAVLQYFNAHGSENKNVETFFDMAESVYQD